MNKKEISAFFDTLVADVIVLFLIPQVIFYFLKYISESDDITYLCSVCLFTSVFYFYSFIRLIVSYNKTLRESYWEKNIHPSFKGRFLFLINQKSVVIKVFIIALLYIILPLNWTAAALQTLLNADDSFASKLKVLAIYLPVVLILTTLGQLSAYKRWSKNRDPEKYTDKKEISETLIVATTYSGGTFLITMLLPQLLKFLALFYPLITFGRIVLVAIIILILIAYRYIRTYFKRKSCIRNIEKVCSEKGYALSKIRDPYISMFRLTNEENFRVTIGENSYSCKFICARNKKVPLAIFPNGILAFVHSFHIRNTEIFSFSTTHKFGYNSADKKILIASPTPYKVYTTVSGKTVEIDNGENIGDYKFFTASAFIRALELDFIDR